MANSSCIMPQPSELVGCNPGRRMQKMRHGLGIVLFLLSFAFYGCLALVPFATISSGSKLALSSALVICGEASFWISVLILGKEAASRFRPGDKIKKRIAGLRRRLGVYQCQDEMENGAENEVQASGSRHEERGS